MYLPVGQSVAGQPQFFLRRRPWWSLWKAVIFWALRLVQRDVVFPVLGGAHLRGKLIFKTLLPGEKSILPVGCYPAADPPESAPETETSASLWAHPASRPAWCRICQQGAAHHNKEEEDAPKSTAPPCMTPNWHISCVTVSGINCLNKILLLHFWGCSVRWSHPETVSQSIAELFVNLHSWVRRRAWRCAKAGGTRRWWRREDAFETHPSDALLELCSFLLLDTLNNCHYRFFLFFVFFFT